MGSGTMDIQARTQTVFQDIGQQIMDGGFEMLASLQLYTSRLNDGERMLGICAFTAVIMLLAMLKKRGYSEGGGMGRQAVLAFLLIFLLTSGAFMIFDGFESIGDAILG